MNDLVKMAMRKYPYIFPQALSWQTPALVSSLSGKYSVDRHVPHHIDMGQMKHQPLIKAENFD